MLLRFSPGVCLRHLLRFASGLGGGGKRRWANAGKVASLLRFAARVPLAATCQETYVSPVVLECCE